MDQTHFCIVFPYIYRIYCDIISAILHKNLFNKYILKFVNVGTYNLEKLATLTTGLSICIHE